MKTSDIDIIVTDMRKHGPQASWDWEADLRFAQAISDDEAVKDCQELLRSANRGSIWPLLIIAHQELVGKRITRRRVRALRRLVQERRAKAFWLGTGPQGRADFGVGRVRHYKLLD
jgi:hypothetical protein